MYRRASIFEWRKLEADETEWTILAREQERITKNARRKFWRLSRRRQSISGVETDRQLRVSFLSILFALEIICSPGQEPFNDFFCILVFFLYIFPFFFGRWSMNPLKCSAFNLSSSKVFKANAHLYRKSNHTRSLSLKLCSESIVQQMALKRNIFLIGSIDVSWTMTVFRFVALIRIDRRAVNHNVV